jgi:hypothetical protein
LSNNHGGIRRRTVRAKNLQIPRELEPRREVEVVKDFDLVLDSKPPAEREQIEVVLQLVAQVCVRVGDAELIASPAGNESVAAETNVKERCDGTRALIRQGDLPEEPHPSLAARSTMYCRKV